MTSRNKFDPDFLRVLNENLKEVPTWRTLMEKVTTVINDTLTEQVVELARSRETQHLHRGDFFNTPYGRGRVVHVDRKNDPTGALLDEVHVNVANVGNVVIPFRSVHTRDVLIDGARLLGFDYFSDSLTDEDYARVYKYIGRYWDDSYGFKFVDFMGFLKSTRFEIEQLWTNDKGDFATSDDVEIRKYDFLEPNHGQYQSVYGSSLDWDLNKQTAKNNLAYPTSHVQINYDLSYTDHTLSEKDMEDIICLFYFLAPIHLVLERINAAAEVTFEAYSDLGKSPQIHNYAHTFYVWEAALDLSLKAGIGCQIHTYVSTGLYLNSAFENAFDSMHGEYAPVWMLESGFWTSEGAWTNNGIWV